MELLNGLPNQYDALISAIDVLGSEESVIRFDFIKACVMQEEQRISMRSEAALAKSETSALVFRHDNHGENCNSCKPRPRCSHCKRICHTGKRVGKSTRTKLRTILTSLGTTPLSLQPRQKIPRLLMSKSFASWQNTPRTSHPGTQATGTSTPKPAIT